MKALKRLNEALPGLTAGILAYGLVVWLIGIWFVRDRLMFTTGLLIGIGCAVGMAIHIAVVLLDSVALGDGHTRRIAAKSVLRYLVVAAIFFAMMYFHLGSLISAFIGVLGLKISAYAQPFFQKTVHKPQLREDSDQREVRD